jgi:hypothetical protein
VAFTCHLLVVANRTVDSPELIVALTERAAQGPIKVTLLAPAAYHERDPTQRRLQRAIDLLRERGISAESVIGDSDPLVAVQEAWNPGRYDEVFVSTFTTGTSRWMLIDLPHRVARLTDAPVRHVVSPEPVAHVAPPRPPPKPAASLFERIYSLMRTRSAKRV